MSIDLLNATSVSNSAFRVVCGEMLLKDDIISHQEALFGHIKSGSTIIKGDDGEIMLNKNDIFFVAPNVKFKFLDINNAVIDAITLNFADPSAITQDYMPQNIIRAMLNGNCTGYVRITPNEKGYATILENMNTIVNAETEKWEFFQLLVYSKMYEIFYELFCNGIVCLNDIESKSKKYHAMHRVTHYIDDHFADGISLEDVAEATGISRYYVSHLFKELMKTTFIGYVNEQRLNRAAMLLLTSNKPIIEIAAISGFNNLSNFNRAFKMHFGKTPSAYRKS